MSLGRKELAEVVQTKRLGYKNAPVSKKEECGGKISDRSTEEGLAWEISLSRHVLSVLDNQGSKQGFISACVKGWGG